MFVPLILAGVTGVIFALINIPVRNIHRSGLFTTCVVLVLVAATGHMVLFAIIAVATVLIFFLEKGNISATGSALMNAVVIVQAGAALYSASPAILPSAAIAVPSPFSASVALKLRPAIIHIVLDGYASGAVLSQVYGHDNAPFEAALTERGFTVMRRAFSPYNQTLLTVASVFGGTYIEADDLPDIDDIRLRLRLGKAVSSGAVPGLLQGEGYRFAAAQTPYGPLRSVDDATRGPGGVFVLNTIESSLIAAVWPSSPLATMSLDAHVRAAFDAENLAFGGGPVFYFQHILSPHPPFSIAADGKFRAPMSAGMDDASHLVRGSAERRARYREGYVAKLAFTNQALLRQLANLPAGPVVVFVHGDHGGGLLFDHESLTRSCAFERYGVFFAVYSNIAAVQQAFAQWSDADFNLVNIYRILFAALSDTEIAPLPDVSFFSPWTAPRSLTPVPADVRAAACD